jgi:ribosome biogenesis protein MAK21
MAKTKGKRSSGADSKVKNVAITKKKPSDITADSLPSFDATALTTLTQKIEQKLQDQAGTAKGSKKSLKEPITVSKKDGNGFPKGVRDGSKKGKKRARNGDVIGDQNEDGKAKQSEVDVLKREVLALGGDQADFDLIKDLDSQSEVEYRTKTPAKSQDKLDESALRKELARILHDSGQAVNEHSRKGEEAEMGDMEEDTPVLRPSSEVIKSTARGDAKANMAPPKEYSRLVSYSVHNLGQLD